AGRGNSGRGGGGGAHQYLLYTGPRIWCNGPAWVGPVQIVYHTSLQPCRRCCSSDLSLHGNQNYMFLRRNEKCNLMEHFVCRWFFKGLSRYKAEELLMQTHNCTGAFLVRESESNPDQYSLSVLKRPESYLGSVKHYRISRIANGWFYIAQRLTFSSLQHLVEHYTEFTDGLCCTLDKPCFILGSDNTSLTIPTERSVPLPLAIRRPTINWKDVTRSMLFRGNRAESEHSLVSDGLREAISSYLYMTEINEGPECLWLYIKE
uniref:Src like adaptor 2a n=1 Tax=Gadus morhua TaxID=8049 RepID=A0A8C5F9H4_GADMO